MTELHVGDPAPPFALWDQHGYTTRLEDFRGRKLLVYFYPEADTPGCTTQSCDVRDHRQDLKQIGVGVVGISPDAPGKQLAFDEKFDLGFPLLSDETLAVAHAWDVWRDDPGEGETEPGILRSSFLVGEDGTIAGAWYGVTAQETVPRALAALQNGDVADQS